MITAPRSIRRIFCTKFAFRCIFGAALLFLLGLTAQLVLAGRHKPPATSLGELTYFYDEEDDGRLLPAEGYIAAQPYDDRPYDPRMAVSRSNLAHLSFMFEITEWRPPVPFYSRPIVVGVRSIIQLQEPPTPQIYVQKASSVQWQAGRLSSSKSSVPARWEPVVRAVEDPTIEQFAGGPDGESWISSDLLRRAYRACLSPSPSVTRVLPAAIALDLLIVLVPITLVIGVKWLADCIIAMRRVARGNCLACAYPYPDDARRCPECGNPRVLL